MKRTLVLLIAGLMMSLGLAGCGDHGHGDQAAAKEEAPNAHTRIALQFDDPATEYTNGLEGLFQVYQNPAADCSPLGPLVSEEPTEMTDAGLLLALVGDVTSADSGTECVNGRPYCLLLVEDSWEMGQALDAADKSNDLSWESVPGPVTLTSPNPMPFQVCEGLTTSLSLEFDIGNGAIQTGAGIVDVSIVTTEVNCGNECTATPEEIGDPICVLMNSSTNSAATPECKTSCANNSDCPQGEACVGGNTEFPGNKPGFCAAPEEVLTVAAI